MRALLCPVQGATLLLKEAVERQVEVPALCFSVVVGAASREGHWQDAIEVREAHLPNLVQQAVGLTSSIGSTRVRCWGS